VPPLAPVGLAGLCAPVAPSLVLVLVQQLPEVCPVSAKLVEELVRRAALADEILLATSHSCHRSWLPRPVRA